MTVVHDVRCVGSGWIPNPETDCTRLWAAVRAAHYRIHYLTQNGNTLPPEVVPFRHTEVRCIRPDGLSPGRDWAERLAMLPEAPPP